MMFKTHLAAGALAGIFLFQYSMPSQPLLFAAVFLFASVFPDIDTTKSVIGKRLWPISALLTLFSKHRGFFHTIWIPMAAYGIGLYFNQILCTAFALGYLVHIASDLMTSEGVSLFSPLSKHHMRGFIKTGGVVEYVFLVMLCVAIGLQTIRFY